MVEIVIIAIYLGFASLGASDSLLGSAWPSMQQDYMIAVSGAGIISMITSAGKVVACLTSDRLGKKFGEGKIFMLSSAAIALSLFGISRICTFSALCAFSISLGLGSGFVDVLACSYVAVHYDSKINSWLQCMWGIGASVGPFILGSLLSGGFHWSTGYLCIASVNAAATFLLFCSLPRWQKNVMIVEDGQVQEKEAKHLTLTQILKLPHALPLLMSFFFYTSVEQTASLWSSSYLTNVKCLSDSMAASFASALFIGITLSRFVNGFLTMKFSDHQLVKMGSVIITAGIVVLFLAPGTVSAVGLIMIGLGLAPLYPCMLHHTASMYGREYAAPIVDTEMAFAFAGQLIMPPLFGLIAGLGLINVFPFFLLGSLIFMVIAVNRTGKNE